ncbi:HTH-type transcriptional regulator YesS [compost metagenome]
MVSEYITQARIERAKYLLSQTPLKIYDVASICGYQSPKHFMLVFKQQTGQTPGAFRNNYDNSNEEQSRQGTAGPSKPNTN